MRKLFNMNKKRFGLAAGLLAFGLMAGCATSSGTGSTTGGGAVPGGDDHRYTGSGYALP